MVVAANRSFYLTFKVNATTPQTNFSMTLETVNGIFRSYVCCLEKSFPEQGVMENYEVEHDFPSIGQPG